MAVKTYKKGSTAKLSANFKVSEFDCNGRGCCAETLIDGKLVEYLQKIRDHFGKPVNLSSGYRCPTHNGNVANAVKKSKHTMGLAADIKVEGVAPAEVAKYAESLGILGIGLYNTDKDGHFVHIDTRTTKAFWFGHAQQKLSTFGGVPEDKPAKTTTTAKTEVCNVEVNVLKKGAKGAQVKAMQTLLIGYGFSCGSKGSDGDFGSNTEKALKDYQKNAGLTPDGSCGPKTWAKLLGVN